MSEFFMPLDYWDTLSPERRLRVQRGLFRWAIAYWLDGTWGPDWGEHTEGKWVPCAYFWRKNQAIAKLVELKLRGFNVEL